MGAEGCMGGGNVREFGYLFYERVERTILVTFIGVTNTGLGSCLALTCLAG